MRDIQGALVRTADADEAAESLTAGSDTVPFDEIFAEAPARVYARYSSFVNPLRTA